MSTLSIFLKSIADAIRKKKGTTNPINAQNFATEIENLPSGGENTLKKLLDATKSARYLLASSTIVDATEYISFEDTANVTNMLSMFNGCPNLTTIPQLDTANVTNMTNMFNACPNLTTIPQLDTANVITMYNMFYGCSALTTIPQLDTAKVTNMSYMFRNCTALTTIPQLDTANVTNMGYMFEYCTALTTIPQLDMYKVTSTTSMFKSCKALTNLKLLNIKKSLQVGSGSTYGHLLTIESLIGLCQECITGSVSSNLTLTVGSANLEKLSNIRVKLADNPDVDETLGEKLPMVQCGSTDEGAMSISNYMSLKNWKLA